MTALALYREQMHKRLLRAVSSAAEAAAHTAHALAPYGDGRSGSHLADTIHSHTHVQGYRYQGCVTAEKPYAIYVELGTSRMAAHPYLRPALRGHKSTFFHELSK